MENTLENKAKLFAQYLNQRKCVIKQGFNKRDNYNPNGIDEYDVLELTPLHLITDEEAIRIANRCLGLLSGHSYLIEKSISGNEFYVKISNSSYIPNEKEFGCNVSYLPTDVTDDLRLKGIAIPFNGLSVSEQVERGWVVLETKI